MSTLPNVTPKRGELSPPCAGIIPCAPSKTTGDGVSVRYAPDPSKKWYVMRATYHREKKAYDYLVSKGVEVYLPLRHKAKIKGGKRRFVIEPLLPNLLFVYTTPEVIKAYSKNSSPLSFLNHYYDHFHLQEDGHNPPLVVSYEEMMNFIQLTSVDNEHVKVVNPENCHYKSGDMVRGIDGQFKGVVGRVARIAGQQRVVVEVKGVCLVSTAYVPSAFIEKMNEYDEI